MGNMKIGIEVEKRRIIRNLRGINENLIKMKDVDSIIFKRRGVKLKIEEKRIKEKIFLKKGEDRKRKIKKINGRLMEGDKNVKK